MKQFLIIFREPDGRQDQHTEADIKRHRQNWANWMDQYGKSGNLAGGSSLTLSGTIIKKDQVFENIHRNGAEIVGGFLLLKANDLTHATAIMRSCPIYEFDGYAEIREYQTLNH